MLGPLAFGEFPAANSPSQEAGMGADKHQTSSGSCISRMRRGSFYIRTPGSPTAGGQGRGHAGHARIPPRCQGGKQVLERRSRQSTRLPPPTPLNLSDGVKCSFLRDGRGPRGLDTGLLCVSKVVSTLGATSHLSASP